MGKTGARGELLTDHRPTGRGVRALDSEREDWKLDGGVVYGGVQHPAFDVMPGAPSLSV